MQNQLSVSRRFANNAEMYYRAEDGSIRKISRQNLIKKLEV